MNDIRFRRAEHLLALTTVALGAIGLLVSRNLDFTESKGTLLVDVPGDYMWGNQLAFNPLGALLMLGTGLVALAAVRSGSRRWILAIAMAAGVLAIVISIDLARADRNLGSRSGNVAILLVLGLGLTAIELSRPTQRISPDP